MGNKKPVRPRRPILTPLSQGIAPAYAGAASPGLTKPVNSKVKPALKRVKMKIVAYLVNSINYMHCLLLGPEIESGRKWGLRSKLQLGLRFVRHPRVPLLKPSAQFLVEDLGPNL